MKRNITLRGLKTAQVTMATSWSGVFHECESYCEDTNGFGVHFCSYCKLRVVLRPKVMAMSVIIKVTEWNIFFERVYLHFAQRSSSVKKYTLMPVYLQVLIVG